MLRSNRRDFDAGQWLHVAGFVKTMPQIGRYQAQGDERGDHVCRSIQHGVVEFGQGRRIAQMVDVTMGHEQKVDLAQG